MLLGEKKVSIKSTKIVGITTKNIVYYNKLNSE